MPTDPGHPAIPLRIDPATINPDTGIGTFATVVQDSVDEVKQCARVILRTTKGHRIEDPDLGITDPRFGSSVDVEDIQSALDRDEDRAAWQTVADPITGDTIGVHVTGTL